MSRFRDPGSAALRTETALRKRYTELGSPSELDWQDYDALAAALAEEFLSQPEIRHFDYLHPVTLQDSRFGVGKSYVTRLAYKDPGGDGEPVVAVGGITNVIQRFDFLMEDARPDIRVIGLDLAGRGLSGWLAELSDYTLETYIEQLKQFLDHLQLSACSLLGSSLGGTMAISFAARYPERVRRIVLNDSGPYIPAARRTRRARAVARHYVFRRPSEFFRRMGAAERNEGPVPDSVLLHNAHHKTRWSEEEQGRIYRHDLRALLAYRATASESLDIWNDWKGVACPVLLLHGTLSDATTDETVEQMRSNRKLSVIKVPRTGHTPSLSNRSLTRDIVDWIHDDRPFDCDRTCTLSEWPPRILYPNA